MQTQPSREVEIERFVRRCAIGMVIDDLADPPAKCGASSLLDSHVPVFETDAIVGGFCNPLDTELWPKDDDLECEERDRAYSCASTLAAELLATLAGNSKTLRALAKRRGYSPKVAEAR